MDVVARAVTSRQENNNTGGKAGEFVKEKGSDTHHQHSHAAVQHALRDSNLGTVKLSEWRNLFSLLKNTTFASLYQAR